MLDHVAYWWQHTEYAKQRMVKTFDSLSHLYTVSGQQWWRSEDQTENPFGWCRAGLAGWNRGQFKKILVKAPNFSNFSISSYMGVGRADFWRVSCASECNCTPYSWLITHYSCIQSGIARTIRQQSKVNESYCMACALMLYFDTCFQHCFHHGHSLLFPR